VRSYSINERSASADQSSQFELQSIEPRVTSGEFFQVGWFTDATQTSSFTPWSADYGQKLERAGAKPSIRQTGKAIELAW